MAAEGGNLYEQPPIKPYSGNQSENWWTGIAIIPRGVRQGLLPSFHIEGTWFQKSMYRGFLRFLAIFDGSFEIFVPLVRETILISISPFRCKLTSAT